MKRLLLPLFFVCSILVPPLASAATPMIEAGSDFSLFLGRDGIVQAVGSDASGQLGQGRALSSETPLATKAAALTKIAAGRGHNLAIASDKTLLAWGDNAHGQLGDGTDIDRSLPQRVGTLDSIVAIAAGHFHSLAVRQDGSVWAWGNNYYGQLGDGSTSTRTAPVAVTGIAGVHAVAAGRNHTLALKADGTVWAWGRNFWGQLGNASDVDAKTPVQVRHNDGSLLTNIVAIAAGDSFSLAIDGDGNVLIWGYLYYDAGTKKTQWVNNALYKTDVPLARAVAAGRDHVLMLDWDGYLWAWGGNYYGQIGNGTDSVDKTVTSIDAFPVDTLSSVLSIAAGQDHSLAVKTDGTVWRWGFTGYDAANDIYRFDSTPQRVAVSSGTSVAAGGGHSLVLTQTGQIMAWGDNADGQLGDGALIVRSVAVTVGGLSGIDKIAAGRRHGLALKTDGSVLAWGAGDDGQLGNGRDVAVSRPGNVADLTGVAQVAAGGNHSLAIRSDKTVWAWGNNYFGQLGNGNDTAANLPKQVVQYEDRTPLANIVSVCGGYWHSAAVAADGSVWRWGYNYYNVAKDSHYYFPGAVKVTGIPAASSVACGAEFTLVRTQDGTVWGWGNNYFGQMGNDTDIDSVVPSQVSQLTGVSAIAAGYFHSLALKSDGTVWRWGYSHYDPVARTNYYSDLPEQVADLSAIAGIAAGDWHSLVLRQDGGVSTWGFNFAGQLGDGSFEEFRASPQFAVNAAVNGLLDLDTSMANTAACPIVVQADKTGSVDAVTASFRLYVGTQGNCLSTRKRAASGYQVFVAANNPAAGLWFLLKGVENGAVLPAPTWTQYLGGPLPVFAANAGVGGLDEHVQGMLIDGVDTRQLAGFDVYVGYGDSAEEMLAANRVKRIFTLGADGRPSMQK